MMSNWNTDIITQEPDTLVSLARVAIVVNEFFHLTEDAVSYDTPFVWWDRSKRNEGIALPMPEPVGYAGRATPIRAPLWYQQQIVQWFGQWRDLEVPECSQAGDRLSNRGHVIPSPYREKA